MPDNNNAACGICCILLFMIIGVVWLWMTYPAAAIALAVIMLLVAAFAVQKWYKAKQAAAEAQREATRVEQERRRKREQFEQEQTAKGLVRFIDENGNERWGTEDQVREWQREEKEVVVREKETIIREIVKVRCRFCGKLYDEALDKCPHCGGYR